MDDPRRRVPRTDVLLADPRLAAAERVLGRTLVKSVVAQAQQRARAGEIEPEQVADTPSPPFLVSAASLRPVINATGVVVHTNLGRAPLSQAALDAVVTASGATDVRVRPEDRSPRPPRSRRAGRAGPGGPAAGGVHVVNNNAAALLLTAMTLAPGKEIVVSRGELIEIGDGFRLPELMESTGSRIREVGTTNRTHLRDYADAIGPDTGFVLKVHPSNYHVTGFTSAVPVAELAELDVPLVVDIGSGLLTPHPLLPDEPDATTVLRDGADLVTASGDKLLGGPQAGLLFGDAELIERLRRHPAARALRVDKLTLAALEATLVGPPSPVAQALDADVTALRARAHGSPPSCPRHRRWTASRRSAAAERPGVELPSAAVSLPESYAAPLRTGTPAVVGRLEGGRVPARSADGRARRRRRAVDAVRACSSIATAGHVDHGKSTLVHRLTGMWPDRLAEEQRRGLTIDLGFAWTEIDGRQFAFVDVPGHERFVANMLAGVGPVPAVMFVVAATEGWMPQSDEHLAALHALGVRHVLVVISKADLADPAPRSSRCGSGFADAPVVLGTDLTGSSRTVRVGDRLPPPDRDADVRLWVDRSFTVRGAGTVVTGTLGRGHYPRRRRTRTRRAARHRPRAAVAGPGSDGGGRGGARRGEPAGHRPSADRPRRHRAHTRRMAGDRRDRRRAAVGRRAAPRTRAACRFGCGAGACPPTGHGRCAAAADAAAAVARRGHRPAAGSRRAPDRRRDRGARRASTTAASPRRRTGPGRRAGDRSRRPPVCARANDLRAMGFPATGQRVGEWVVDPQWWAERRQQVMTAVNGGPPSTTSRRACRWRRCGSRSGCPPSSWWALLDGTGLEVADGVVRQPDAGLPPRVDKAVHTLEEWLAAEPFRAPEADELAELKLGTRELAAAVRVGRLTRIADGVVLGPDAFDRAAEVLRALPQPFTVSEAQRALGHHPPCRGAAAGTA